MFAAWSRMSRDRRRSWAMVAGFITVGTVFKVAYFKWSRGLMVDDTKRQQQEGLKHLQEAQKFAEWSQREQQKRLQELTPEQEQQMYKYLQLVEKHGLDKFRELQSGEEENCEGCPVFRLAGRAKMALRGQSSME